MSQAGPLDRAGYLVKQVQQAFHRACEDRLRPLGVSMSQYAVLRAVADTGGAPAAELARRTFVTRQSLRDVLAGLTAAGLVEVGAVTTGRARPVTLTGRGEDVLARAEQVVLTVDDRMTASLTAEQVGQLTALLRSCAADLAAPDEG
ncbi:MarR family winged helix-turn-helix transcriptional regulator [Actinokineospora bangkokensis]|uniref:MarR family transcriptional regulator n=1 Tax=Actinokineospora bangkokensis TaxID=1193682 RepID=A0A1Q9LKJ1_9PSEU|nr:MarR family transcriptional regulator [Actinokineospora bangkokensis]OLR92499.1 MarR family transcriptional regulator [Actinokineospora bangkokensis]